MPDILAEILGELGAYAIILVAMILFGSLGLVFEVVAGWIRNRKANS